MLKVLRRMYGTAASAAPAVKYPVSAFSDYFPDCRDCIHYIHFPDKKNSVSMFGKCAQFPDNFAKQCRIDTFKCGYEGRYYEEGA